MHKRFGLFIDGSNLYASARVLGFRVDFSKILNYYKKQGDVAQAAYFTALPPKTVESPLRRMVDFVEYNGFTLIQKETQTQYDVDNNPRLKGNMDVEIAVHVMEIAHTITNMVLFSGDGDFRSLIESVQRRHGVFVSVVSARALVADSLRRQSNEYTDLADLKADFIHEAAEVKTESAIAVKRRKFLFE